ncbi:MAG: hypothetical protein D6746_14795 [Bacteroidetes bacterium]|nr:MAG: hypothetical protein D6746_14795 [Bacteroidota bacterium]
MPSSTQIVAAGVQITSMRPLYPEMQTGSPSEAGVVLRTSEPPQMIPTGPHKSLELIGYGEGNAGDSFSASIYGVKRLMRRGKRLLESSDDGQTQWLCLLIATIDFTLGSLAGTDGRTVEDEYLFADTAVLDTTGGYHTYLGAAFGKSLTAYSPGSNLVAVVGMGDIGNHDGIWIDVGVGTPGSPLAQSGNVLVSMGT